MYMYIQYGLYGSYMYIYLTQQTQLKSIITMLIIIVNKYVLTQSISNGYVRQKLFS